jgi:hypothetical protein
MMNCTGPNLIYLQHEDTWATQRVFDDDVIYVRWDMAYRLKQEVESLRATLRDVCESCNVHIDTVDISQESLTL